MYYYFFFNIKRSLKNTCTCHFTYMLLLLLPLLDVRKLHVDRSELYAGSGRPLSYGVAQVHEVLGNGRGTHGGVVWRPREQHVHLKLGQAGQCSLVSGPGREEPGCSWVAVHHCRKVPL